MSFAINLVLDDSPGAVRLRVRPWLVLVIILAVLAAIIWGTLGLHTTGLFEDWGIYNALSSSSTIQDLILRDQPTRPLLLLSYWISYHLTPGSFIGLNLLEVVLFFSRSMLLYGILRRLRPDAPLFAFTAAVLFAVYPAETGWFTTRYASQLCSVVMYLLSVHLQLLYWRYQRWWIVPLSLTTLLIALGLYEASYPLVILTPVLFLWLEKRFSRRVTVLASAWYVLTFTTLLSDFYLTQQIPQTYQQHLLTQASRLPLLERLSAYGHAILTACFRALAGGWWEALQNLRPDALSGWLAALAAVLIATATKLLSVLSPRLQGDNVSGVTAQSPWSQLNQRLGPDPLWFMSGLGIVVLGFSVFAFLPTHRVLTERVYMFSSIGGAICIAAGLHWLGERTRNPVWVLASGLGLLAGVGLGGVLPILLLSKTISIQEQSILSQIVEQAPRISDNTLIVVFDQTHQLTTSQWLFAEVGGNSSYLQSAVEFVYAQPTLAVALCDPGTLFGSPPAPPCTFDATGVSRIPFSGNQTAQPYPAQQVVIFSNQGEGQLKLVEQWPVPGGEGYNPSALIDPDASPPPRVYSLFNHWPVQGQIPYNEHPHDSLDLNFVTQSRLFLDMPTYPFSGYGWQSDSGVWMTATRATIDTWLAPNAYHLQLHAQYALQPEEFSQLRLQINGQSIPLQFSAEPGGRALFTATLPKAAIARDRTRTRLLFTLPAVTSPVALGINTDTRSLSIRFDWLGISPVAGS